MAGACMNYRVTCLTPTLVGDGQKLSPIDYMVWKDHVNVLDQRRIIKLLAKGSRLDGYLNQVKKAEKLDFASWGGFAQNFAGRRIPFEHPGLGPVWERQRADALFIPTFAAGASGPYLPASAVRGALHTALLFSRWNDGLWKQLEEHCRGERLPRRPAEPAEDSAIGSGGSNRMRAFQLSDCSPISPSNMKVYLSRTSTLLARGQGKLELGWKAIGRGNVDAKRVEDASPLFCEMASPGTAFEGRWSENQHLRKPEILRSLRWKEAPSTSALLEAANQLSATILAVHRRYAAITGLTTLDASLQSLENTLSQMKESGKGCLLCIGWGGGFLSKTAAPDTEQDAYRRLLREMPFYNRAIQTGMPFPKTRRVVFLAGQPAVLPGWVQLEVGS
jgi:CRISPR-associated protein Csm5